MGSRTKRERLIDIQYDMHSGALWTNVDIRIKSFHINLIAASILMMQMKVMAAT